MANHTQNPLTPEQCATIRSMSLYWKEVRQRADSSPLQHEAFSVLNLLTADGLLRLAEFAADPNTVACVNACGAVNPENPAAAAEALAGLLAVSERILGGLRGHREGTYEAWLEQALDEATAAIALATGKGA